MSIPELDERLRRLADLASVSAGGPDPRQVLRRARRHRVVRLAGSGVLVVVVVLAVVVAGPGLLARYRSSPASPASGPAPMARYSDPRLTFTYPAAWTTHVYPRVSTFSSAILFLSSQQLRDPCVQSQTDSGTRIACGFAVGSLLPGQVYAEWSSNGVPGWTLDKVHGRPQTIGGQPAKVIVSRPGACTSMSGDETITATITQPGLASSYYQFLACLRGPNLDVAERQIHDLLEATRILA